MPRLNPSERGDLGPAPEVKPVVVPSDEQRIAAKAAKQTATPTAAPKKTISKEELSKKLKKRAARRKVPTVRRGAGGQAESTRTPIIPQTEEQTRGIITRGTVARVSKPRVRKTRTGKKLDKVTGKVLTPTVRRGEGGKIEAIPQGERANVTRLPEAGQKVMQPDVSTLLSQPQGMLKKGGQRNILGFSAPHARVKAAVDKALEHLDKMKQTQGTPEFDQHEQAFDAAHAEIQDMDKHGLGITVGALKHQTLTGKQPHLVNQIHDLIKDRLQAGKDKEEENKANVAAGRTRASLVEAQKRAKAYLEEQGQW